MPEIRMTKRKILQNIMIFTNRRRKRETNIRNLINQLLLLMMNNGGNGDGKVNGKKNCTLMR